MARPLRIEYEGAFYHITARGNERKAIYRFQSDYDKFKSYLKEAQDKYGLILHCYVLMGNHYHLLIETPKANLSKIMHFINSAYTTYFNITQKRNGHLFQGRYKAYLVERDSYLLELSRYVHLNPVRAKIVNNPEDYPYSSYKSYIVENSQDIVTRDLIRKMIAGDKPEDDAERYKNFINSAIGTELTNPIKQAYGGMILGSEAFIKNTIQRLKGTNLNKEEVSCWRKLKAMSSESIIDQVCVYSEKSRYDLFNEKGEIRNLCLYLIKKYTSLSNKQIGQIFGNISYSAVAKAYERFCHRLEKNPELAKEVATIMSNVKG